MPALRKIVKNSIDFTRSYLDHRDRNQTAFKLLKTIKEEKGKLSASNKKLCNEYAMDVLGKKIYAPWLYVYTTFSGEFKEGWIPDNYYGQVVIPNVSGIYGDLMERNAILNNLLNISNSIDICYHINNLFYGVNNNIINSKKVKELLFKENKKVVFKVEDSAQGRGIYFFDEKSFKINTIAKLGNGVFQSYIKQHSFFSNFTKNSVATVRITTVCDDNGNISAKAGWLKFARGNDTHCMGDATIKIPYNVKTGKLYDDAYFGNWTSTKVLPNLKFSFAGEELPLYQKCLNEAIRMHKRFPFARCLGWDLIIDKNDKVIFIEVNGGHAGIRFTEAVQGPCFKGLGWENLHRLNK